jgi:hypothetical protein
MIFLPSAVLSSRGMRVWFAASRGAYIVRTFWRFVRARR